MKKYLILLVALASFAGHSQISFGAKHFNKSGELEKGELEKFKSTTTIFVLSDVIDKNEYEKILKETWTVTPYKILTREEYELIELYQKNYSFVELMSTKKTKSSKMAGISLYTYLDIGMYNVTEIDKELPKVKTKNEKKRKYKIHEIFTENKKTIARIHLFPTRDFVDDVIFEWRMYKVVDKIYSENVFFNYTTGMLKNYFQKANNLIEIGDPYAMSGKDFNMEEIAKLSTSKLYVPNYLKGWKNTIKATIDDEAEAIALELFSTYEFDYEFISTEDLDSKIASGKEFFYLRYVVANNEKFVQIVNSKTGDIIFRDYITGMSWMIKKNNIEYLSKIITNSKKNLAK